MVAFFSPSPPRNLTLLSFGDEADEEEQRIKEILSTSKKSKSLHDYVQDDPTIRPEDALRAEDLKDVRKDAAPTTSVASPKADAQASEPDEPHGQTEAQLRQEKR